MRVLRIEEVDHFLWVPQQVNQIGTHVCLTSVHMLLIGT